MPKYPIPECVVTYNPATRLYCFAFSFPGKPPHYKMDVFDSIKSVLEWVDPHNERIWEEPSDAAESRLVVSRRYKPGSVEDRLCG